MYTKGKWEWSRAEKSGYCTELWTVDGNGDIVDDVLVPSIVTTDGIMELVVGQYSGNFEANARLIAAAPDLLEACKALIKLMLDQTALDLDKQGQIDDLTSALTVCTAQFNSTATEQAKQAIAKAESEV